MSFLGGGALAGAAYAASLAYQFAPSRKRQRSGHSSSQSSKKTALTTIRSSTETSCEKRLPAAHYRLNSPKFLKLTQGLGPLKDLFFPLITDKLDFGFVSNNGVGNEYWETVDNEKNNALAPRGNYRGLAFFTLRHSDITAHRNSEMALNASRFAVRKVTGAEYPVHTAYRRYTSNPSASNGIIEGDQANLPPTFTDYDAQEHSKVRVLPLGINLPALEDVAWGSSNFVPPQGVNVSNPSGAIGNSLTTGRSIWDGSLPIIQRTPESNLAYYPANVKDAVMRIVDGYLYLDITNTSKTHSVVEVVIHSFKKNGPDVSYTKLYDEIFAGYKRYAGSLRPNLTIQSAAENTALNSNTSGGWQSFYDPVVPLLSCPSKFRKKADDVARECHRSNHVLSPGQSKEVKIALGGLYYSLGNKTEDGTVQDPVSDVPLGAVAAAALNAGMLSVAVGHTGFQALETFLYPSTNPTYKNGDGTALAFGSGFWAGKTYSPSSIAVSGKYSESFYPMYIGSHNRVLSTHSPLAPTGVLTAPLSYKSMPTVTLTDDHVTTTSDEALGRSSLATGL